MKIVVVIFLICTGLLHTSAHTYGQSSGIGTATQTPLKILILGNSITQHNPAPLLGWNGHWGMAASEESKDYVHLIIDSLKQSKIDADVQFANIALAFEQRFWNYDSLKINKLTNAEPDILILRLGDNISEDALKEHSLQRDIKKLTSKVFPHGKQRVIVTSAFWDKPAVNSCLKKSAKEYQWEYVELSDLSKTAHNTAVGLFADAGVAKHPSDRGMKEIAQRILKPLLLMAQPAALEKQ
ncbi:alpha-galactosidase [Dyadobacter sp. BE34]|uniref:Alpha-galactosidase n=1 Tax=Dyadobacter fermentans TaxID=94254 RepID=A0ABU1R741_9BACT|nr:MULTISPECIES: SGNH/GDSL hydrolase family protein [Dyadobacter]MDR6809224.1 alpha-galactosidase [Dyadobacter fermentans]MDR7046967.1 alpha-galactosidase [Dyadobacter sp. BE242]MDR7201281.1 alpha-galactosidase [Dyadobacter sp. BE34]MDR7219241.1 alpha-galactosidase [Dyadobacter sp. BE31]MDR7264549.1 alpha-galactosidase [Dyadobacter sp. BE32]